jgi:hypothetical protein
MEQALLIARTLGCSLIEGQTPPNRQELRRRIEQSPNYSSSTLPNQVSAVEYRIVRGQLKEAQLKSGRNFPVPR